MNVYKNFYQFLLLSLLYFIFTRYDMNRDVNYVNQTKLSQINFQVNIQVEISVKLPTCNKTIKKTI